MKKRLLPCLAVLFLLLTACGVGHMGVHALEDITDADIVANEMGYSAVLCQSYSDTFSCEASWESFRGVEYLWTLPGNEARTVHVTYAEQECGDYRVVLVLPDDTVVELSLIHILEKEDAYGYSLTQRMKEVVELSESTLYPVLRRLQQSGCLTVYDKPFQGRNRRYYAITPVSYTHLTCARRACCP